MARRGRFRFGGAGSALDRLKQQYLFPPTTRPAVDAGPYVPPTGGNTVTRARAAGQAAPVAPPPGMSVAQATNVAMGAQSPAQKMRLRRILAQPQTASLDEREASARTQQSFRAGAAARDAEVREFQKARELLKIEKGTAPTIQAEAAQEMQVAGFAEALKVREWSSDEASEAANRLDQRAELMSDLREAEGDAAATNAITNQLEALDAKFDNDMEVMEFEANEATKNREFEAAANIQRGITEVLKVKAAQKPKKGVTFDVGEIGEQVGGALEKVRPPAKQVTQKINTIAMWLMNNLRAPQDKRERAMAELEMLKKIQTIIEPKGGTQGATK